MQPALTWEETNRRNLLEAIQAEGTALDAYLYTRGLVLGIADAVREARYLLHADRFMHPDYRRAQTDAAGFIFGQRRWF